MRHQLKPSLVQIVAWCQAIICTNAGIVLIGPLGIDFNEIFVENNTFSFKKMHLKTSSGKCRPFFVALNVLKKENKNLLTQRKPWLTERFKLPIKQRRN